MLKTIVLVGMMGSGKTSVGKELAKSLNLKFIDRSELLFGSNFDDESININIFKSKNSVNYNFLMSNVISKLLSSS